MMGAGQPSQEKNAADAADAKKAATDAKQKEAEAKQEAEAAAKLKKAEEKKAADAAKKAATAASGGAAKGTKRTRGVAATPTPPEAAPDDAPDPKQAKRDAKKKLDDFRTLISLYGQELTSGKMILRNIGTVASWDSLADEKLSGDLRRAVDALETTSTTNALVAQLVTQKLDVVRASVGEAEFDKQIDPITSMLKPKVDKLNAEVDSLNQMHALLMLKAQGSK